MEEKRYNLKKVLGNSAWQIGEKIITMIIGVVVSALIARYLGVEQYGIVNYVISTVTLFTTFSVLGMETITIKDLVHKENETNIILGSCFIIRILGGILLIALSQITLYILSGGDSTIQILGAIMATCMLLKAFEVIEYYIQSVQKMKVSAIIRFVTAIVVAIYRIIVIFLDLGMIGFIASYLIDAVVVAILLYIWYKNKHKEKWKFDKIYAKHLLKNCWYLAISGLMSTIYMKMDQVMLGTMLVDKTQNGIYSAAVRIAELWYFIPLAVIAAFQPSIMESKKRAQEEFISLQQKLYDIIAIIGIIAAIGISIFGKIAVYILYGDEYVEAASILLISVWAGLFATLGSARSPWLISEGLQKYTIIYITSGAITNIILNGILIPKLGGYGAAIATLIAQMMSVIIVPFFIKKVRLSAKMMLKSIFVNRTFWQSLKIVKKYIRKKEKIC